VVEEGLSDTVFRAPRTAYAAELIASIPRMGEAPAVVLR
jgi:ABC-type dipeptide/oligopeptide/nickel transport system ATPase component